MLIYHPFIKWYLRVWEGEIGVDKGKRYAHEANLGAQRLARGSSENINRICSESIRWFVEQKNQANTGGISTHNNNGFMLLEYISPEHLYYGNITNGVYNGVGMVLFENYFTINHC